MASSDPQREVSASTRNSTGVLAESPVEARTVRETGRVSERVHTRQPLQLKQPKTDARGTRQGQPNRRAPNGYDTERAPASAGASGRHNEPCSRPGSACPAQPPSKSGRESPRDGERHQAVGRANRSTASDATGRGAAHHAGPRGMPERHAAGHNHGTWTGAMQQRPPGASSPDSARHNHKTTAEE